MKKGLRYIIKEGKHILVPVDNISKKAQDLVFEWIENEQKELIDKYDKMTDDERFLHSNEIASLCVNVLFNGDGASFRSMIGYNHKGLMTDEELKNIKRDFEIAKAKKKNKEFRFFILLDLLPLSNRRADAIIITNDYDIELYDFSEGKVVKKISESNINDLTISEIKQKKRKEKQQARINSYKGKIKMDSTQLENVIVDDSEVNVYYYDLDATFYDFNNIYEIFQNNNYQITYIPNSICFLMRKVNIKPIFISRPLKANIDSPFFITSGRPVIKRKIIDDIYNNDTYIGISLIYARLFIDCFTHFSIKLSSKAHKGFEKGQLSFFKNKKKKYVYLVDDRTDNWAPIGFGVLEKHMFMNMDLETMMTYISKICNPDKDDNFHKNVIKYDLLLKSHFNFFVLKGE